MTTQQVANRLVELMRQGDSDTAYAELFATDASAHEMPGLPNADTYGLEALKAKSKAWEANTKEVHSLEITDPLIYGEHFAVGMGIDVTKADGTRSQEEEMCIYHVRDGKIKSERFVYAMG